MSRPDLTYRDEGLFVNFYAETPAGEEAWNTMAASNDGVARFLAVQRSGVIAQLQAAGYRVAKAKPHKPLSPAQLHRLLEALDGDLSR